MNQFVIFGIGNTSENIIEDCLFDLPKDSMYHIYTYRTKLEGVCRVYDWLLDNKASYIAYHNNTAPAMLTNEATKAVESTMDEMIDVARNVKATVLYLWNNKDEAESEKEVTKLIDSGLRVLDLTQGLTPFLIVDNKKEVNDTVDSLKPVTREEYEEMPLASLKQQAAAHGVPNNKLKSKEEMIEALIEEMTATVVVITGKLAPLEYPKVFKVTEQVAQQIINDLM